MMNNNNVSVDNWLLQHFSELTTKPDKNVWEPGFDAERRIVIADYRLLTKVFERPKIFTPRFYHSIYPIPIDEWYLTNQTSLYDGFCSISVQITIRFQATIEYAQANIENIADINDHIKTSYKGLVMDTIEKELNRLNDGEWIQKGLADVEQRMATNINEDLMVNNIQCRTFCTLKARFKELTIDNTLNDRFTKTPIYLSILQKNFEFREKQNQELFRQQQALAEEQLLQKRKQVEQHDHDLAIERQQKLIEAESEKKLLLEKENYQAEQLKIKTRLQAEQIKHKHLLHKMSYEAKLRDQKTRRINQIQLDEEIHAKKLEQNMRQKEIELAAEIEEFKKQHTSWNEAKLRLQEEKTEQERLSLQREQEALIRAEELAQTGFQEKQAQLQLAKIEHETSLNHAKLAAQLKEQEERYQASKQTEEYLRREIELLVLEKQRAELSQQVDNLNPKQDEDKTEHE